MARPGADAGRVASTAPWSRRYLQRKFDEGGAAAVEKVFPEVLDNIVELMVDPFGNYLVQKLLDRCSEQQRLEVSGDRVRGDHGRCGAMVGGLQSTAVPPARLVA